MGELGWSREKWKSATLKEFNYAAEGYWRNWERFAAVPMREICFTDIAGNPYIKASNKPTSPQQFMKLSIDPKIEIQKPTEEDIKKAKEFQKTLLNGKKQ